MLKLFGKRERDVPFLVPFFVPFLFVPPPSGLSLLDEKLFDTTARIRIVYTRDVAIAAATFPYYVPAEMARDLRMQVRLVVMMCLPWVWY